MSRNRLRDVLENKTKEKPDDEVSQAAEKIENQKRLSTQEFQKVYEIIWQEGPTTKYKNPGAMDRETQSVSNIPNL